MTAIWGSLAAVALLWPDRIAGPFDGVPLDRPAEAILIGALFPVLLWYGPRFLRTRFAQLCIVLLLAWKLSSTLLFAQQGWCVRFEPGRPYVNEQTGAPHAWDIRADWRAPNPECSAIMTRPYRSLQEFPAWFFNLPPPDDGWPGPLDRPPGATTSMTLRGFLKLSKPSTLRFDTTPEMAVRWSVDGGGRVETASLDAGVHLIALDAALTGENWRLRPLVDDREISWAQTSLVRPWLLDRMVSAWARWIPTLLVVGLGACWLFSAARDSEDTALLVWTAVSAATIGTLVLSDHVAWARIGVAALTAAAAMPFRARSRNLRGAFLAIGIPWGAFVVSSAAGAIGRFVIYESGHDYWMYQRFAYRIVMQGHWLEGGSATFWFQPFYRWIVGALHLVFGDSSIGEWFWDGACLLAIALMAFTVARRRHGFRWGLVAGVLPLAVFVIGTPQYLIGRGLGEISSAGLLSAAAILAMRSRHGQTRSAVAAGVLATLAFFTRLNNLPMAAAVSAFAFSRRTWKPAATVVATVSVGGLLFAGRNWYFTGAFGLFEGTQRNLLAIWQPGMSIRTGLERTLDSVLMVLTVNDPPRFDPFAVPVMLGALVAALAIVSPAVRRIAPLPAVWFFLAGIAAAFVARGSAYPGRFSLHILGVTCALSTCAVSAFVARATRRPPNS